MSFSADPVGGVHKESERLSLSATQIAASGLAAVSATVAASWFGVAGTVIGAGLGSVISVVGSAVYSYSIRRTRSRVRQTLDVAVAQRFNPDRTVELPTQPPANRLPSTPGAARAPDPKPLLRLTPRQLAGVAGGLFIATLAVTTGFELASGQPLASTVSGKQGSGTSLTDGKTSKPRPSHSVPGPAGTSSGGSSGTGSGTGAASTSGSATPTVTVTVTPSGSASPSEGGSASPSGSSTSGGTGSSATPTPTGTPTG